MNNSRKAKRRKPPMPGTKRKVIIRKRVTNVQLMGNSSTKCVKEKKIFDVSNVSNDDYSEELIQVRNNSRSWTIQEVKGFAKTRGGQCLSNTYIGTRHKYIFKCHRGHVFENKLSNIIYSDQWCPRCVIYVGEEITRKAIMDFKCNKGHIFKTSYNSLISNKSWCHSCKVGKRSISDMKELAAKNDGECLSSEYKNLITPLEWKCQNGHAFMRKPQYIYNGKGFCMECKKY
jgi:hypothetical protein